MCRFSILFWKSHCLQYSDMIYVEFASQYAGAKYVCLLKLHCCVDQMQMVWVKGLRVLNICLFFLSPRGPFIDVFRFVVLFLFCYFFLFLLLLLLCFPIEAGVKYVHKLCSFFSLFCICSLSSTHWLWYLYVLRNSIGSIY